MQSLEDEDVTSPIPTLAASGPMGVNAAGSKEPVRQGEASTTEKGGCMLLAICAAVSAHGL